MTTFAALLRAVNVGGAGAMKMAELKSACEKAGFTDVRTLLQSGNIVFTARGSEGSVARKLGDAIEQRFGFRPAIMLRTAAEMDDAIDRNPFKTEAKDDPQRLVVIFAEATPTSGAAERIAKVKVARERLVLSGRELYAHYPDGQGRSKVTNAVIERALGVPATARNWNTVTKLAAMMAGAE